MIKADNTQKRCFVACDEQTRKNGRCSCPTNTHQSSQLQQTGVSGCVLSLPEIGKTYNCFDDGKIRESRMYQVTINEIIPFEKADDELLELWKEEGVPSYWLFEKTDYFIKFTSNEFKDEPNGVFARTKYGGWFGLGNFWNSGKLDIDGSLTDSLLT